MVWNTFACRDDGGDEIEMVVVAATVVGVCFSSQQNRALSVSLSLAPPPWTFRALALALP